MQSISYAGVLGAGPRLDLRAVLRNHFLECYTPAVRHLPIRNLGMNKKARLVLQILSVITALEALGGIVFIALTLLTSYLMSKTSRSGEGPLPAVYFYGIFANVVFIALLAFSAVLIWRMRRTGIALLVATIGCEVIYFFAPAPMTHASRDSILQAAAFSGVGNPAIGLQLITAFPLVALGLIALCFRYLRPDETGSPRRKGSATTTFLFRTLAVATCAQILYGIYEMAGLIHFYPGWRQRFAISHPHFPSLFVAIVFVNVSLAFLLTISALSLWRLREKSLSRISWIFGFEILYVVLAAIWSARLVTRFGEHQVRWFGIMAYSPLGMPMIWSQSHSYYLFVAPGIVIASYISRGLSDRTFNSSMSVPISAAK
jgi:hypothetical protein